MKIRAAAAFAVLVQALAGCGSPPQGKLEVDAQLTLCKAQSCVGVPAQGADVEVLLGDAVVATGQLDAEGRFELAVVPGQYRARVSIPSLDLDVPPSAPIDVADGGGAGIPLWLPKLEVARQPE